MHFHKGASRMPGYRCMVQSHGLPGCSSRLSSRRHPEQHAPGSAQRRWRPRHLDGLWRSSRHRRYSDICMRHPLEHRWLRGALACPGAMAESAASLNLTGMILIKQPPSRGCCAICQGHHTSWIPHGACAAAVVQLVRHIAARTGHLGEDTQRRLSRPQRGPRQIRRRDPAVFQDYLVRLPSREKTLHSCSLPFQDQESKSSSSTHVAWHLLAIAWQGRCPQPASLHPGQSWQAMHSNCKEAHALR